MGRCVQTHCTVCVVIIALFLYNMLVHLPCDDICLGRANKKTLRQNKFNHTVVSSQNQRATSLS